MPLFQVFYSTRIPLTQARVTGQASAGRLISASLFGILLLLSAACTSRPAFPSLAPAWSDGRVVAESRSPEPPALGPLADGGVLMAWADDTALYTRLAGADGSLGAPASVVTGISPWDITLIPGTNGEWHLLWRDFDVYGIPRLSSAHLDTEGRLLRGPLAVSPEGVGLYSAMPGDGGTAVVVWASPDAQPDLYGKAIDAQGRPGAAPPARIARHAETPALTRTASGNWIIAWLAWPESAAADSASRIITLATSQAALPWERQTITALDHLVFPDMTTYVETFTLGLDHDSGYVFTGLRDAATGTASTTLRAFSLETLQRQGRATAVELPVQPPGSAASFSTGFNTGPALTVTAEMTDRLPTSHPAPTPGQHATLPVAFTVGDRVLIGYFAGGALVACQPVIQATPPPGALIMVVDRALHLTLSWASPAPNPADTVSLAISGTRLANPDITNR